MGDTVIGNLVWRITGDTSGIRSAMGQTEGGIRGLINKFTAAKIAGAAIGTTLAVALKSCVNAAAEAEEATAKLNQVVKSTGGAAGMTVDELENLASALQAVTRYDDEAIMGAESLLLTFTKIGRDVFPQATEAVLDVSSMLGQDLKSSAVMVGKALNDPILGVTTLRRVGVQLSEQQTQQIKSFMAVNNVAAAQKIILGELATQMGGQARASADTFRGGVAQLKNNLGDVAEIIGNKLLPAMKSFVALANTALSGVVRNSKLSEWKIQLVDATERLNYLKTLTKDPIYLSSPAARNDLKREIIETQDEIKKLNKMINETTGRRTLGGTRETGSYTPYKTGKKSDKPILSDEDIAKHRAALDQLHEMNMNFKMRILEMEGKTQDVLNIQQAEDQKKLDKIKYANKKEALEAQKNLEEYYRKLRVQAELESLQKILSQTSQMINQLSGLFSQYFSNKQQELENDEYRESEAIAKRYEQEKSTIESTITDRHERDAALKTLDEKRAREEKALSDKIEKQKRKIAHDAAMYQKGAALAQTVINTAQAVSLALATWPWPFDMIVAGIVGTMGAAQAALIAAQPLPAYWAGGVSPGGRAVVGERGPEIIDLPAGSKIRNSEESRSMARNVLNIYFGNELLYSGIYDASQNGDVMISRRAVVA